MKNKKGFTLIELIIVIAILAVIMLIGTADVFPGVAIVENTEIDVGDYIYYTPGGGTATITGDESGTGEAQTFTVNATESKWRVIANNGGQLDIVPAEGNIGKSLTLYGKAGYANAIGILNRICGKYTNSTYATEARSLGYTNGVGTITKEISYNAVSSMKENMENFNNAGSSGDFETAKSYISSFTPYMDTGWFNLLTDENGEKSALDYIGVRNVWLASRDVNVDGACADFLVSYLYSGGRVSNAYLYCAYSGSGYSDDFSLGVCPRVSLKSGIKILSGEGSSSYPYSMTKTEAENPPPPLE